MADDSKQRPAAGEPEAAAAEPGASAAGEEASAAAGAAPAAEKTAPAAAKSAAERAKPGAEEPAAQSEKPAAKAAKPAAEKPAAKSAAAPTQLAAEKPAAAPEKPAGKAAKPAAAKPGAEKPAAAPAAAAPAAAEVSRRGFFSWAAVAWVGFTAAIGGCVTAFSRFMFPNVLFEPPTSFKVGRADDYPPGVVDERFKDQYGVWIVNNEGRIYALIAICTHLGCPPNWLEAQNKFKCPCHGSGYYRSGINFEGPTPRPLERAAIWISPEDGQIVVDKARKYQWELGQWEDPNSYILMG